MAYNLTGVKAHVKRAAEYFGPKHGIKVIGGWRAVGSVPNSDHPKGLALDFMTRNKAQGDALAADLVANYKAWNITYVIWWRRIWSPAKGWHAYNGPSAHTDHVHASFESTAGSGDSGMSVQPVGVTDSLKQFGQLVPTLSKVLETLTSAQTYRDAGFVMIGAACIILGILLLVVGSAGTVTRTVTKSVVRGVVSK